MKRNHLPKGIWVAAGLVSAVAVAGIVAAVLLPWAHAADLPFFGTRWTLVQLGDGAIASERAPSVTFGSERVAGFDGCTTFFADGSIDAAHIRIDAARSALAPVACPRDFLLPGAFRYALYQAVRASVEGDRMALHAADGRILARFRGERRKT